jgi:hypothetical protein
MSHHRIHAPEVPPEQVSGWKIVLFLFAGFALFATLFLASNWLQSFRPAHITTRGKILETRQVIDGLRESTYGGRIVYGVEARVVHGERPAPNPLATPL